MPEDDPTMEALTEYHPFEFPPRAWHVGPSESERDARGVAYFKVGREGVEAMIRNKVTGDVYIHCRNGITLVHSRMGWAFLQGSAAPQK
jgi:hypothetical protein